MPITLVGSSRELKHKRFLPPIDLLDVIAGGNPTTVTADSAADDTVKPAFGGGRKSSAVGGCLPKYEVIRKGGGRCLYARYRRCQLEPSELVYAPTRNRKTKRKEQQMTGNTGKIRRMVSKISVPPPVYIVSRHLGEAWGENPLDVVRALDPKVL